MAPPPPAPPPPPAAKAKLAELKPIALDPTGSATVDLNVERNGKSGPIKVAVSGAPEGVVIEAAEIAEGKSAGQLKVAASEKLGDTELKAKARVTIKVADSEAEQPLEITVRKVNRPSFLPVAEAAPGAREDRDAGPEPGAQRFSGAAETEHIGPAGADHRPGALTWPPRRVRPS